MTKEVTHNVNKFLRENGYKSRMFVVIHDEADYFYHEDDPLEVMFMLQKIHEDIDSQVPIVSDLEVSLTNWADKVEINNIEELRRLFDESEQENN